MFDVSTGCGDAMSASASASGSSRSPRYEAPSVTGAVGTGAAIFRAYPDRARRPGCLTRFNSSGTMGANAGLRRAGPPTPRGTDDEVAGPMRLEGRRAIVTGGAGALGTVICRALVA